MGERTERQRAAASTEQAEDLRPPTARGTWPAPGLTRATEGRIGEDEKRRRGGLVRALEWAGIILLFLGAIGVLAALLGAAHAEVVVVALGGAWSLILAGTVFLWMGEVLWRLRRIDERARGDS